MSVMSVSEANLWMSDVGESSPAATCMRNILLSLLTCHMSQHTSLVSHLSDVLV